MKTFSEIQLFSIAELKNVPFQNRHQYYSTALKLYVKIKIYINNKLDF